MVLPIIFNLRQWRRRRVEHTGLRLLDHADRLTETKTGKEMKGQKLEKGKKKKKQHTTNYKSLWQSYKTDKKDAFIALKPCFSLTYSDVFCVFLNALAMHMRNCLSYAPFYFYPVNNKVLVSLLSFKQVIRKILLTSRLKRKNEENTILWPTWGLQCNFSESLKHLACVPTH